MPHRAVRVPPCQREAFTRRKIMRKARSRKATDLAGRAGTRLLRITESLARSQVTDYLTSNLPVLPVSSGSQMILP
jgi:hypothetical protein